MMRNSYTQSTNDEPELLQLAQENGSLRVIIAELLIKNQSLRWELQGQGCWPAHDPRLLIASEGTPSRRNSRTAGTP
jgi:hypothetical protein